MPLRTVTLPGPAPIAVALERRKVPAEIKTEPVLVLLPDKTATPEPVLKTPPDPLMFPLTVMVVLVAGSKYSEALLITLPVTVILVGTDVWPMASEPAEMVVVPV